MQASPTTDINITPTALTAADLKPDDAFLLQVPAHMAWKTPRTSS